MFGTQGRPSGQGRRTLRERKVSQRMAVVDESARQQATQARLDALEADNDVGDDMLGAGGSDDDDFVIAGDDDEEEEEVEISGKRRKTRKGGQAQATKKKLRAGSAAQRMPRTFARLLDEAMLDKLPPGTPSYLTASVGPPTAAAARKFCTVCGNNSAYKCPRCGSRYCCRRCYNTHVETRCLKFIS